jgi:subfamily B ATP-binding cassette protein MsbA
MQSYYRLIKSAEKYILSFTGSILCMLLLSILNGFSFLSLVPLIDRVLSGNPVVITASIKMPFAENINRLFAVINNMPRMHVLWYVSAFVIIMFFIKGFFDFYKEILMEHMGQGLVKDLSNNIYSHLQDLSIDYIGRHRTGELVSRITNDIRWVQDGISRGLANTLSSFFELIVYLFFIVAISWKFSVFCILVFALLMVPIIVVGKKLRKLSAQGQGKTADMSSLLFETISGIRVVKAFGMEKYEQERFRKESSVYYSLMMKTIKRAAVLGPLVEFIGSIMVVGVLLLNIQRVINGDLTSGWFAVYIGSLVAIIKPVKKISQMNPIIQRAVAAGDRIYALLDVKPQVVEAQNAFSLPVFSELIRFSDVHFGYKGKDTVLKGIDFTINKGQVVAIVGPSGVGKTTLVNLIPRFYDPTGGNITIDGYNIKNVSLKSLRDQLGIVTQESILFNDTVRANIAYGDPSKNMDDIIRAAEMANAHNFIIQMPKGYDTVIGERGFKVSGGERQRLCIARAILKNPPILILDEATSSLDTENERLVQDAISKLMKHRTVIVIAHRLSTIQQANCIVVLKDGHIVQKGTHDELIAESGIYKTLYEMQFNI